MWILLGLVGVGGFFLYSKSQSVDALARRLWTGVRALHPEGGLPVPDGPISDRLAAELAGDVYQEIRDAGLGASVFPDGVEHLDLMVKEDLVFILRQLIRFIETPSEALHSFMLWMNGGRLEGAPTATMEVGVVGRRVGVYEGGDRRMLRRAGPLQTTSRRISRG